MTPRKIQWGRQPSRGSKTSEKQTSRSLSGQKRRSASRGRDQVDPKKGKTDTGTAGAADGRDRKVLVGIDWQTTAIEEPAPKTSSQHPSFKPDRTGASKSPPEPKVKSAVVVKGPSAKSTKATEPSGHCSQTPARSPKKNNKPLKPPRLKSKDRELTEKEMVRDQAYDWIAARANRLDPQGYVEETRSLKFFGHQQVTYGLEIIAIIDWARKYLELGMRHPLPTLPMYLFSSFVASRQTANSPLKKDKGMYSDTDDIRERFQQGWILMAAVLQFWTDEQSILDGEINGGRIQPASALAQYVMKLLNHLVPEDLQITWEQIVERTPWVRKRLDATEDESRAIFRQPIPITGEASALEVATEKCYEWEVEERSAAPRDALDARAAPSLPAGDTPRPPVGQGAILKAKLDKMNLGKGWTCLPGKESGPNVGQPYEPRRRQTDEDPTVLDNPDDTKGAEATRENPGRSPLS